VYIADTEDSMPTDNLDAEARSLMPPPHFSRRGFLTTTPRDGWQRLQGWFQRNGAA